MKKESPNGQSSKDKGAQKTVTNKTIGPASDLEQHLQPDWWKRIFNSMYLKTDSDVVDDSQITKTEVDLFQQILNVQDGNTLLDLACGQGRHLLEFNTR